MEHHCTPLSPAAHTMCLSYLYLLVALVKTLIQAIYQEYPVLRWSGVLI